MSKVDGHAPVYERLNEYMADNPDPQDEYILTNYERDFPLEANRTVRLQVCLGHTMIIARLSDGYLVGYNLRNSSLTTIFRPVAVAEEAACAKEWRAYFTYMLNELIHRSNLNVSDTARNVGISRPAVYNYSTGGQIPSAYITYKLAKVFGCSVSELIDIPV